MQRTRRRVKLTPLGRSYPIIPCDADKQLVRLLSPPSYDRLNSAVREGVVVTYRRRLTPACRDLLDNERCLKEEEANPDGQRSSSALPRRSPEQMTNFELYQAITMLVPKVDSLARVTEAARSDTEILDAARTGFKLDLGFKYLKLRSDETKAFPTDDE
jgi:hypothetical protein